MDKTGNVVHKESQMAFSHTKLANYATFPNKYRPENGDDSALTDKFYSNIYPMIKASQQVCL